MRSPTTGGDFVFDMNVKYVYRVLKATLAVMLEQGTGGSIVSIGSDAGTAGHGSPKMVAYGAAKAGLAHLVTSVALEYGPDGIRMNMVSPGPTETGATSTLTAAQISLMNAAIPLRHRGKPEDIANAVIFFASPLSKQVTGQILGVDGGVSVQSPMPDLSGIGRSGEPRRNSVSREGPTGAEWGMALGPDPAKPVGERHRAAGRPDGVCGWPAVRRDQRLLGRGWYLAARHRRQRPGEGPSAGGCARRVRGVVGGRAEGDRGGPSAARPGRHRGHVRPAPAGRG